MNVNKRRFKREVAYARQQQRLKDDRERRERIADSVRAKLAGFAVRSDTGDVIYRRLP